MHTNFNQMYQLGRSGSHGGTVPFPVGTGGTCGDAFVAKTRRKWKSIICNVSARMWNSAYVFRKIAQVSTTVQ